MKSRVEATFGLQAFKYFQFDLFMSNIQNMFKITKMCQPSLLSQKLLLTLMSQFGQVCETFMEVLDKTEQNFLSKKYTQQKLGVPCA